MLIRFLGQQLAMWTFINIGMMSIVAIENTSLQMLARYFVIHLQTWKVTIFITAKVDKPHAYTKLSLTRLLA